MNDFNHSTSLSFIDIHNERKREEQSSNQKRTSSGNSTVAMESLLLLDSANSKDVDKDK